MVDFRIQFAEHLPLGHANFFDRVVHLQQVVARKTEGFQQNSSRHFPTTIDSHIKNIPGIELEIEP